MIAIKRPAAPSYLARPEAGVAKERAAVLALYKKKENLDQSFTFKAYSHEAVKTALNRLFRFKCAYCESFYGATQPLDVEHFRPKGAVAEFANGGGKKRGKAIVAKPGYYWLASEWNNLLPSCIDCNRQRQHDFPDGRRNTGKANFFPLENPDHRQRRPGGKSKEKPLLLDPTVDDPSRHLVFHAPDLPDGLVRPQRDPAGNEDRRGRATIDVFGLHRPGLVQARRSLALKVRASVQKIAKFKVRLAERPNDPEVLQDVADEVANLKLLLAADEPYLATARAIADAAIRSI
jgi:hypothetical protein